MQPTLMMETGGIAPNSTANALQYWLEMNPAVEQIMHF